jgi:hypothetical protein
MKKKDKVVLLTREETRAFLKTTFPTLRKWTADGLLPCYHLGGRVYYKQHEILQALQRM